MAEEKLECTLNCPKCHETWGKLKFKYGSLVNPDDVIIVSGKKKKFKKGESLACTICGYEYTNWDVILAIGEKEKANA